MRTWRGHGHSPQGKHADEEPVSLGSARRPPLVIPGARGTVDDHGHEEDQEGEPHPRPQGQGQGVADLAAPPSHLAEPVPSTRRRPPPPAGPVQGEVQRGRQSSGARPGGHPQVLNKEYSQGSCLRLKLEPRTYARPPGKIRLVVVHLVACPDASHSSHGASGHIINTGSHIMTRTHGRCVTHPSSFKPLAISSCIRVFKLWLTALRP